MTKLEQHRVMIAGSGARVMMFAHGFGCNQNMWRLVAPAFYATHRTIVFDYIGAGGSDLSAYSSGKYSSLNGYATDVIELCDLLGVSKIVFTGHSVSAMIGVLAAARRPDLFAHLILIGPSPCYLNDGDYHGGFSRADIEGLLEVMDSNYLGWSSAMAPKITGNPDRPEIGQELTESFCRTDPRIAREFAQVTFLSDNRADLSAVETPALILQCSEDAVAPEGVGKYVHRQLKNSRFVQLRATGHCPHLSEPEETIAAMQKYLEQ